MTRLMNHHLQDPILIFFLKRKDIFNAQQCLLITSTDHVLIFIQLRYKIFSIYFISKVEENFLLDESNLRSFEYGDIRGK